MTGSWHAMKIAIVVAFAAFFGSPARAITCDDVRGLSNIQQDYWSKRLHLSSWQRHVIWVACYRDYRTKPAITVQR